MNRREYIKQSALALGLSLSAGSITQLMSSCSTTSLEWKPTFLNKSEAKLLTLITDALLPKTSTPGAVELGVPQFIDKLLPLTNDEVTLTGFKAGFEEFETACVSKCSKPFEGLNTEERSAFLIAQDEASASFPIAMWGIMLDPNPAPITFYRRLKSLILMAYFSSEKIGEEVLAYAPVPGPAKGCIPYDGQNAWAE